MLIEKAMKTFGINSRDIKGIVSSPNLLVTEVELKNGMTLQVNTLTKKSKLTTTK